MYAIREGGQLECWGTELEVDGFTSYGMISSVPDTTFVSASVGSRHVCGVTDRGRIKCWGIDDGNTDFDFGQVTGLP